MSDAREQVLLRLVAIAEGITGIESVTRNSLAIEDYELPSISILDADEEIVATGGGGMKANAPMKVQLKPQVAIFVRDDPLTIGPTLTTYRNRVIKAILGDATLFSIVGSNGAIEYLGMQTGLGAARSMKGEAAMQFGFTYVLKPSEL